jgi:hypothetical protein
MFARLSFPRSNFICPSIFVLPQLSIFTAHFYSGSTIVKEDGTFDYSLQKLPSLQNFLSCTTNIDNTSCSRHPAYKFKRTARIWK